jgi:hypothetical protein
MPPHKLARSSRSARILLPWGIGCAALWCSWSTPAGAACSSPEPAVAFSYPDASITSVPPDAVFWAVATTGAAGVTLDGVALAPLGQGLPERYQFAPEQPLSPGPHELSISVLTPEHQATGNDRVLRETTLSFDVTEQPALDAQGEIVAVTSYPLVWPARSVAEDLEGDCSADVIELTFGCYDIIPEAITRLDLSTDPNARGYVIGNYLLPADCKVFFPYGYSDAAQPPFSIAAITPSGLGPAAPFTGEPEWIDNPPGLFREHPPGWCSLAFGASARHGAGSLTLLSWAALLLIRRRAWAR